MSIKVKSCLNWGGCSSVGRAGGLVRILAPLGRTELHVEVSLCKILNPKVAPDVQMALKGQFKFFEAGSYKVQVIPLK